MLADATPAELLRRQDELRWATECGYFRELHGLLPSPLFQTLPFLGFLLAVLAGYWLLPRRWAVARVWLLVVASFHFYAAWNAALAFVVVGTATLDYALARWMDRLDARPQRRLVMLGSVGVNLSLLGYLKYRGFFLNELHDLLGVAGAEPGFAKFSPLDVVIPFGISFYTFEAVSYAVDVFRRRVPAERSLPHFLLFILFFPHLVAGPIVRAGDFLRQAHRVKRWNWLRVQVGVQFFLVGLVKKLAVADRMAQYTDPVFADPAHYSGPALWVATVAYALRIYADFSGYSDMAVGTAHLFGYRLSRNFDSPYLSRNVGEFWRRWHISLSTWLRDYVYIPLGGGRGSRFATDRNLMLTMLLGGLWHGPSWGYVAWGAAHGLLLVGHRRFREFAAARPGLVRLLDTAPGVAGRAAVTFLAVSLCWVLFQPSLSRAGVMLTRMASLAPDGGPLPMPNRGVWYTAIAVLACELSARRGHLARAWAAIPAWAQGLGYAAALNLALLLAPEAEQSFIYFAF